MKHLKTLSVVAFILISFVYFEYSKEREVKIEQNLKALNSASMEKNQKKNLATSKDYDSVKSKN